MKYFIPALLWGLAIFILCVIPGKDIPSFDWGDLFSTDKLAHALFYFILVVLVAWGYKKNNTSYSILKISIYCILYGIGLEFAQKYLCVDRFFEVLDMIANSVGAIIAYLLIHYSVINLRTKQH
jgi:VanZ family protein